MQEDEKFIVELIEEEITTLNYGVFFINVN